MEKIFSSQQASCVFIGDYPGWKPQWNSEFVQIVSNISKQVYGSEPHIHAVHAGLECGIFLGIYPYMHCISFGPHIRNPHSPDEEVDIDSVAQFWKVLLVYYKLFQLNQYNTQHINSVLFFLNNQLKQNYYVPLQVNTIIEMKNILLVILIITCNNIFAQQDSIAPQQETPKQVNYTHVALVGTIIPITIAGISYI
jgi:hypothetical protein